MKVRELIEELKKYDQELDVAVYDQFDVRYMALESWHLDIKRLGKNPTDMDRSDKLLSDFPDVLEEFKKEYLIIP